MNFALAFPEERALPDAPTAIEQGNLERATRRFATLLLARLAADDPEVLEAQPDTDRRQQAPP